MTAAKGPHLAARTLLIRHLDMHPGRTVENDLDPAEVGIVGDTAHAAGGDSYHLGKDKIRARGGDDRYSVDESPRDAGGLDGYASAMDVGWFSVKTAKGTFDLQDFSIWLVVLCAAGDPDTRDIREVIYSPDGRTVKRWDRLRRRSSGDNSHLFHTHISEFRDTSGTRMVKLVTRWLQHIGLLPEEEDMALEPADIEKIAQRAADLTWAKNLPSPWLGVEKRSAADWIKYADAARRDVQAVGNALTAALQALAAKDNFDEQAFAASLAPAIAAMVLAQLPGAGDPVTQDEVTVAVKTALRDAFAK